MPAITPSTPRNVPLAIQYLLKTAEMLSPSSPWVCTPERIGIPDRIIHRIEDHQNAASPFEQATSPDTHLYKSPPASLRVVFPCTSKARHALNRQTHVLNFKPVERCKLRASFWLMISLATHMGSSTEKDSTGALP